jgi:uncharacterized damage-inducible protein DinB
MFTRTEDFIATHERVSEATLKLLAALTDESLGQAVLPGHRNLGGVAWHIVATIPEMMNQTGLGLAGVDHEAPPPASAREIHDAYRRVTEELRARVKSAWNDAGLLETDELYGETWARGLTLRILIDHEVHHRGQMTVLMRQAGLTVPGIYGPAKEEWAKHGMPEPPY